MPLTNHAEHMLRVLARAIFKAVTTANYKNGAFKQAISENMSPIHSFNIFILSDLTTADEKSAFQKGLENAIFLRDRSISPYPFLSFGDLLKVADVSTVISQVFSDDVAKREQENPVDLFPAPLSIVSAGIAGNGPTATNQLTGTANTDSADSTPASPKPAGVEQKNATIDGATIAPSMGDNKRGIVTLTIPKGTAVKVEGMVTINEGSISVEGMTFKIVQAASAAANPENGHQSPVKSGGNDCAVSEADSCDMFADGGVKL